MSPLEAGFGEAGATAGATPQAAFSTRHIGLNQHDVTTMLSTLGITSVPELLDEVIPANIRRSDQMKIGAPLSEAEVLDEMRAIAGRNRIVTSMIGMGYYDCHTPPVILATCWKTRPGIPPIRPTSRKSRKAGLKPS